MRWSSGVGTPRTLDLAVVFLGGLLLLLAGVAAVQIAPLTDIALVTGISLLGSALLYAATGVVAWWRRPRNAVGPLLALGAVALVIATMGAGSVIPFTIAAVVTNTLIFAVVVHLLHVVPSGRLRSSLSKATVLAGYGVCLLLEAPLYLFDPAHSPDGLLAVADRPELVGWGSWIQRAAGVSVMAVTSVILVSRFRAATPRQRLVLGPLYLYGVAAVLALPIVGSLHDRLGISDVGMLLIQIGILALIPIAFGGAILFGGFARTGEIDELGATLAEMDVAQALRPVLARALGDDTLELAFWLPVRSGFVDENGHPITIPVPGSGRDAVDVAVGGDRVGALIYDTTQIADPEPVRRASRVAALALERQQLTAGLRASEQELQLSRVRIVQAADRERSRIARDLHDGIQVDLVLLALNAQELADSPGLPEPAAAAAVGLRRKIDDAAAGLRRLVHAVMPAPLTARGVVSAVTDLADRMPIPTLVDTDVADRLPAAVESTAYFIVAEALANTVKHAAAGRAWVRLCRRDGALEIEVGDDGLGGANPGNGLGLGDLADRADSVGGRLHIDSPTGRGTRILAELPCAS
jgi:signal transduction histidine kinase